MSQPYLKPQGNYLISDKKDQGHSMILGTTGLDKIVSPSLETIEVLKKASLTSANKTNEG